MVTLTTTTVIIIIRWLGFGRGSHRSQEVRTESMDWLYS